MDADDWVLEDLPRDECLRLMASVPVGRIVYTRQALPAVELVNFAVDNREIVIRTDANGKLAAATRGAVVAFEADSINAAGHAAWSVTVVGQARAVTDRADIRRLEDIAPHPWAPGKRDHLIRISADLVSGRRLRATATTRDGYAPYL
jgi:nitroimidazol reductase NimA-like FMN-containing flavoprotein (pyridoxamine 5'-phosphate oxidase superfamily)